MELINFYFDAKATIQKSNQQLREMASKCVEKCDLSFFVKINSCALFHEDYLAAECKPLKDSQFQGLILGMRPESSEMADVMHNYLKSRACLVLATWPRVRRTKVWLSQPLFILRWLQTCQESVQAIHLFIFEQTKWGYCSIKTELF